MNKRTKITLNIEKPCSENWNSFSHEDNQAYCGSCCRTVIDFTVLDDKEVLSIIKNAKTKVCGRFTSSQLNREIYSTVEPQNSASFKKFLAGLLIIGATQSTFASDGKIENSNYIERLSSNDNRVKSKFLEPTEDSSLNYIEGRVLDDNSNPIVGAAIIIKEKMIGVKTDNDGMFKLFIPDTMNTKRIKLTISSVGYEMKEVTVNKKKLPIKKDFVIKMKLSWMGEVIVTEYKD